VDTNGQTPVYYAIKQGRYEMVEFLLKQGINISHEDKRQTTPVMFAKKHNRNQIVELMIQHGAVINDGKKKTAPAKTAQPKPEEKQKVNERKIPKRYLLTTLREGGYYEPLTDQEFA
jgi:hypothetical protein